MSNIRMIKKKKGPNTRRINLAIEFLKNFKERKQELVGPPVEFDMTTFGFCLTEFDENNNEVKCGTAACAAGSLGLLPNFRRMGLKLDLEKEVLLFNGKQGDSIKGLAAFFGVSRFVSESWFYPDSYTTDNITPKMVAKKMQAYLDDTEKYIIKEQEKGY